MRLVSILPLDDAHFLVNQAKGLPEISSAKELRRRYITSSILLSWVAVEVAIAHRTKELVAKGQLAATQSKRIIQSAELLVSTNRRALDLETFRRLRRARNDIAHPRVDDRDVDLPVSLATETFNFCVQIIQDFYYPTRVTFEGLH